MPIKEGKVGEVKVPVMRDSGCSGIVVKTKLVKSHQKTGIVHTCILIDGTMRRFPMANIEVDTPWYKGTVQAYYVDNPVCDLIIGNVDGARDVTNPDPNWGKTMVNESVTKDEEKTSNLIID
jgi:hypothetical protein